MIFLNKLLLIRNKTYNILSLKNNSKKYLIILLLIIFQSSCTFFSDKNIAQTTNSNNDKILEPITIEKSMTCDTKIEIIGEELEKLKEEWKKEFLKSKKDKRIPADDERYDDN